MTVLLRCRGKIVVCLSLGINNEANQVTFSRKMSVYIASVQMPQCTHNRTLTSLSSDRSFFTATWRFCDSQVARYTQPKEPPPHFSWNFKSSLLISKSTAIPIQYLYEYTSLTHFAAISCNSTSIGLNLLLCNNVLLLILASSLS